MQPREFNLTRFLVSLFGVSLGVPTLFLALVYIYGLIQFDGTCVTFTAEPFSCTLSEFAQQQAFYAVLIGPFIGLPVALLIGIIFSIYTVWRVRQRRRTIA